jgi:hypothetical protein
MGYSDEASLFGNELGKGGDVYGALWREGKGFEVNGHLLRDDLPGNDIGMVL